MLANENLSKINEGVNIPLSNEDIDYRLGEKSNIVSYSDIHKYESLEQLLGTKGYAIILFESKKNYGHWVLIFRTGNKVEFFNSYRGFPDDTLKLIDENYRKKSHQDHTYLTNLFIESPYDLTYNEFVFQKSKSNIKTCGRWVILRLFLRDMDLYSFRQFVENKSKQLNLSPDQFVTLLTL